MSWRVVIATRIPDVLVGFGEVVRAAGHEVVALLTIRHVEGWTTSSLTGDLVVGAPKELDGTPVRALHDVAHRGRGGAAGRLRRRAAPARLDRGAQRGRGQPVQRSGSIHALTRWASRLPNGLPV